MKNKVLIIAEAGVNHNGSLKVAKKLVDAAKFAGADIVKFQTFKANSLATVKAPKAKYQISKNKKKENQFEMLKKLELKYEHHLNLIKYCKQKKIEFLSSAFDITDLEFLKKLKLKRFKVPSGEITNYVYLNRIGSFKKKIILSTGMSNISEINKALSVIYKNGAKKNQITLLHCTSEYPATIDGLNLNAIKTLRNRFNLNVGYSDHTTNHITAVAAVALGAKIIEKHLTLDNDLAGPDHKSSLNPQNFKLMVKYIRQTEKSLGNGVKVPNRYEKKNIKIVRKSIVAKNKIKKGEIFSLENLCFKRPGYGISPMKIMKIIGKKAKKNFNKEDLIKV